MTQQNWQSSRITDQSGKAVIITGSNSGLGLEEAKVFSGKNRRSYGSKEYGKKWSYKKNDVKSGDFIGASGFMELRGYPGRVTPTKRAKDPGPAETLWNLSEALTGVKYGF